MRGVGEEGRGRWGEMTQTMYVHMNKEKKKTKSRAKLVKHTPF
jgi:hypothetical protein